jgi:hypothetical protein
MKPGDLVRVGPEFKDEKWIEDPEDETITDPTGEELGLGLVVEKRAGSLVDVWWTGAGKKILFNKKFLERVAD